MTIVNTTKNDFATTKFSFNSSSKIKKRPKFKNYHALKWKWNCHNSNTLLLNDPNIVLIHPNKSYGTTAVKSDMPLKRNCYTYWEIDVSDRLFGTSIMIGLGNSKASLESNAFINLLGFDENSWGLSHKGKLWHNNNTKQYCDEFEENNSVTIGCLFDGYNGRLSYFKNDQYLGVAFDNIKLDELLYPMVSSTISQSLFKLDNVYQTFSSLQSLCGVVITRHFKNECLPDYLKKFL